METGFDKRLFHKPIIPGPELREVQYGNELLQKPLSESFYQKQIDEVRPKHREAFNKAFRSYQPPDTATNIKPDTPIFSTSLTKVLIPEWFPILDNYNIIHLWSTTPTARFTELLNNIHDLQERCKQAAEQRRQQKWDKEWHEPKRGWSTPVRQENGG
ncbi:hypothetical protein B0T10DRAFT_477945 [Thelonectria olida]|uniref:Uncharacterized protein n=1 Tax=Thelonectria olida TaxID=1576542 RepID=A0A9P8WC92_9HYPO|nr:hypothetical protein B0T10DRAFT_477945 [Thelonectria olida]